VKDPYDYLSQSDLVILPVYDKSLGLHSRLVESMATGRPIVASREACCGLLPYLQESGIEVCDSLNQMVESVCSLLDHPDRLTRMGERNGLLARRLFSPEAVGKSLESAYEQMLRDYRQRC
jgi:glycosyltransferase involved in cell wall biosynthesis